MKLGSSSELKIKYALFSYLYVLCCIAISSYPIWVVAQLLAGNLGMPDGVPVKEQENGWLWVFLFLVEALVIFVAAYSLLGVVLSKVMGWSKEFYFNVFWKGKYPSHWKKQ